MKNTKSIFKEIIILILVLIALALVLAILLYGYSPSGKIVPSKVAYTTPENISEEISSSAEAETTTPVTITYELDETHINNSKKSGSYDSGKQNPFAKPVAETTENTEDSGNTNENQNTNDNNNTNTTSSGNTASTAAKNETQYLPSTSGK